MTDDTQESLGDEMRILISRVHDGTRDAARRTGRDDLAADSPVEAETLARATMRALGPHLTHTQAVHLTGSLPQELGAELLAHSVDVPGGFDREQFLDAVAAESGSHREQAADRAHAVLVVLRGWAPAGEIEGTLAGLPRPLADMFA